MTMIKTFTLAAIAAVTATAVSASTVLVDFENEFPLGVDPTVLNAPYTNNGVTFTSLDGNELRLNQVGGNPVSGFVPNDAVQPGGGFGEIFLGGDFLLDSSVEVSFSKVVKDLTFEIADIDGNQNGPDQIETFTFDFFLDAAPVGSISLTAGDPGTGNAVATQIAFAGQFNRFEINNSSTGGTRNIGWGIDNIQATIVPLPAGGLLMLTGLGAFGLMRRRKKA